MVRITITSKMDTKVRQVDKNPIIQFYEDYIKISFTNGMAPMICDKNQIKSFRAEVIE